MISAECDEDIGIPFDLKSLPMEKLLQLKEELGSKVYKRAIAGTDVNDPSPKQRSFKRINKNRPREQSSRKKVPLLSNATIDKNKCRDPRFDEKCGTYDTLQFKKNYNFLVDVRSKEIARMEKKISQTEDAEERKKLKLAMLRIKNKNTEEIKWMKRQERLHEESEQIKKAKLEGKPLHYPTKKERRAKELVIQYEELKSKGQLDKHLDKKRKKNAAIDRKKLQF